MLIKKLETFEKNADKEFKRLENEIKQTIK